MSDAELSWGCVVVMCHSRPRYLARTLASLERALDHAPDELAVVVSQDGDHPEVGRVVRDWVDRVSERGSVAEVASVEHARDPDVELDGYEAIARHVALAVDEVIVARGHRRAIVIEDDLELAPDLFGFFHAAAPMLDVDPSLLAVCGFNDLGAAHLVGDERRVLRGDCFSSLGWMVDATRWRALRASWPSRYWDDWLRSPLVRSGRSVLVPEVSRVATFGRDGVSGGQFFDEHLAVTHLHDAATDWSDADAAAWTRPRYDDELDAVLASADRASSIGALHAATLDGDVAPESPSAVVAAYDSDARLAFAGRLFGFLVDPRGGVDRGSYRGVITFTHRGLRKFLVPSSGVAAVESTHEESFVLQGADRFNHHA